MKRIVGVMCAVIVLAGCGQVAEQSQGQPANVPAGNADESVSVVASFYPLAMMAERIGGDHVSVTNIVGAADPHDYALSPRDIQAMQDADLVLLQGARLEPWGEEMAAQLTERGTRVVVVTDGITLAEHADAHDDHAEHDDHDAHEDEHAHDDADHEDHEEHDAHTDEEEHLDAHGHDHGAWDPHTWLDPVLAQDMIAITAAELAEIVPAHAEEITANADAFTAELRALDARYSAVLGQCARDALIVSHDAFGYIARRYGFEAHGIAGLSTQDEPSAEILATLKDEAAEGMTHILTEENTAGRFAATLAQETGLTLLPINALATPDSAGADYVTRAESNLASFATALGCAQE